MSLRFAIAFSWLGTGIAVLLVGAAIFLPIDFGASGEDYVLVKSMLLVAPAIVALILGWGTRYLITELRPTE